MGSEIFKKNCFLRRETAKRELLKIREEKCEICGISIWQNQKINLQLHHIDGDNSNNEESNLQLLCPNCHSLTDSFCGKRTSGSQKKYSEEELKKALEENKSILSALRSLGMSSGRENYARCREIIHKYSIFHLEPIENNTEKRCLKCGIIVGKSKSGLCLSCSSKQQRKVERPSREILKNEIRNQTFLALGKKYNVSDNAVRKWCKSYNLPVSRHLIKNYSDSEWSNI